MFILNEGGNHSRIFYLEEFLVLLLHVYRHENSLIYFCLQLFFISSTFLLPAIWQNQSVSSSHFQRRGGTGFKSPNVSRENPLEPRLQNSIWHTNCVYVSARIIFFWSYLTFENWEFGMALLKFTSIFTIQFHDLDLSMHAYYIFYEQDHDLQKVKLDQIAKLFCTVTKKYKVHVENWKFKSAINSIGKLLHALLSIFFSEKLLVRETTKHFPIFPSSSQMRHFKAYLTPRNGQEKFLAHKNPLVLQLHKCPGSVLLVTLSFFMHAHHH